MKVLGWGSRSRRCLAVAHYVIYTDETYDIREMLDVMSDDEMMMTFGELISMMMSFWWRMMTMWERRLVRAMASESGDDDDV